MTLIFSKERDTRFLTVTVPTVTFSRKNMRNPDYSGHSMTLQNTLLGESGFVFVLKNVAFYF